MARSHPSRRTRGLGVFRPRFPPRPAQQTWAFSYVAGAPVVTADPAVGRARGFQTGAASAITTTAAAAGRATGRATATASVVTASAAHGRAQGRGTATSAVFVIGVAQGRSTGRATAVASFLVGGVGHGRSRGYAASAASVQTTASAHGRGLGRGTATSIALALGSAQGFSRGRGTAIGGLVVVAAAASGWARGRGTSASLVVTSSPAHGRAQGRGTAVPFVTAIASAQGRAQGRATAAASAITTTGAAHGWARGRATATGDVPGTVQTGASYGWSRGYATAASQRFAIGVAHGRAKGRARSVAARYTTEFKVPAWYEKVLPSTAPIHPRNADYLAELDGAYYGAETDGFPAADPGADNMGVVGQTTTLNGSITAGATAMTVNSGTGFPAAPFRVKIDSENIVVTSKGAGTNWTIVRFNGTDSSGLTFTAASHNNGATVTWFKKGISFSGALDSYSDTSFDMPVIRPSASDTLTTVRPKEMAQLFDSTWTGSGFFIPQRFRPTGTASYQGNLEGTNEGIRIPSGTEDFFDVTQVVSNDSPVLFRITDAADPSTDGYWASFAEFRFYPEGGSIGGHTITAQEAGWYAQGGVISKSNSYGITSVTNNQNTKKTATLWPANLITGASGELTGVAPSTFQDDTENVGTRGNNAACRCIDYDRLTENRLIPYATEFFCERTRDDATYVWPFDGGENNKGGLIPEGTRLRLKTTIDIDASVETLLPLGQTVNGQVVTEARQDQMKMILRGFQAYGIIVGDNSGSGGRVRTEAFQREPGSPTYKWAFMEADLALWPYYDYWEFIKDNYDPPYDIPRITSDAGTYFAHGYGRAVPSAITTNAVAHGRAKGRATAVVSPITTTSAGVGRAQGRGTATGERIVIASAGQGRATGRATASALVVAATPAQGRARGRAAATSLVFALATAQGRAQGRGTAVAASITTTAAAFGWARGRATADGTVPTANMVTADAVAGRARGRGTATGLAITASLGMGWAHGRGTAVPSAITTTAAGHGRARGRATCVVSPITTTAAGHGRARGFGYGSGNALTLVTAAAHGRGRTWGNGTGILNPIDFVQMYGWDERRGTRRQSLVTRRTGRRRT